MPYLEDVFGSPLAGVENGESELALLPELMATRDDPEVVEHLALIEA